MDIIYLFDFDIYKNNIVNINIIRLKKMYCKNKMEKIYLPMLDTKLYLQLKPKNYLNGDVILENLKNYGVDESNLKLELKKFIEYEKQIYCICNDNKINYLLNYFKTLNEVSEFIILNGDFINLNYLNGLDSEERIDNLIKHLNGNNTNQF